MAIPILVAINLILITLICILNWQEISEVTYENSNQLGKSLFKLYKYSIRAFAEDPEFYTGILLCILIVFFIIDICIELMKKK